jgi:hypothetical protein
MCYVTSRHVHKTTVAVESNKYFIFLCVSVCVHMCMGEGICIGVYTRAYVG